MRSIYRESIEVMCERMEYNKDKRNIQMSWIRICLKAEEVMEVL